jgi:alpha-galactosidase
MNPYYYGDFYPLTTWSRDDQVWIAWQFDRPEQGEGVVQAFRRDKSSYESARLKLRGLDPTARYAVANLDTPGTRQELTGSDLRDTGMLVEIPSRPAAAVISYRKVK